MSNVIELKVFRRRSSAIHQYIHCAKCLDEFPASDSESPKAYQMIEVGCTEKGLQVWCVRHEENVLHLDFEGRKLKALPADE